MHKGGCFFACFVCDEMKVNISKTCTLNDCVSFIDHHDAVHMMAYSTVLFFLYGRFVSSEI